MEKLMNPLFLAVAALALVAFLQLGLYIDLRREMERMRRSNVGKANDNPEREDSMRTEMLRISEELVAMNPPALTSVSIGQSMNLSRRNQVLRMHLRGDSPSRIAGALKISKSEVDLLLKVHRTVMPLATWSPAGPASTRRKAGDGPVVAEEVQQVTDEVVLAG